MSKSNFRNDIILVLGSKSPRRRELIHELGFPYRIVSIDCEESYPDDLSVKKVAEYLAVLKAKQFHDLDENEVLITADTVVIFQNQILGKPADLRQAKQFLEELSGKSHSVVTGVCLKSHKKSGEVGFLFDSFCSSTTVHFKTLTKEEIDYYISNFEVLDKAGGYAIQEWIGQIGILRIEGDFYNVMGLPVGELFKMINELTR